MESNKITDKIKNDFPLLSRKINSKNLVYLDNAATTQKPIEVINAIKEFYEKDKPLKNNNQSQNKTQEEIVFCFKPTKSPRSAWLNLSFLRWLLIAEASSLVEWTNIHAPSLDNTRNGIT